MKKTLTHINHRQEEIDTSDTSTYFFGRARCYITNEGTVPLPVSVYIGMKVLKKNSSNKVLKNFIPIKFLRNHF